MPLKKRYDETEVLDRAMRAFWAHGYEATSVNDLVSATGINRGSLYAAYNGKRSLFVECLRRYDEQHRKRFLDEISAAHSPRDAIVAAFEAAAHRSRRKDTPSGCLLVNTALEVSPHHPELRAMVNACLRSVEDFFCMNIEAGQAEGSIPRGLEPAETAKALLGMFLGLRVLVRSEFERSAVSAVITQARAMLT